MEEKRKPPQLIKTPLKMLKSKLIVPHLRHNCFGHETSRNKIVQAQLDSSDGKILPVPAMSRWERKKTNFSLFHSRISFIVAIVPECDIAAVNDYHALL